MGKRLYPRVLSLKKLLNVHSSISILPKEHNPVIYNCEIGYDSQ